MNFLSNQLTRFKRFDHGRAVSGSVILNFASAGLAALSSVVFARVLGITNFGLYVYVVSAIGLLGSFATLGLPTLVTRQVATWCATKDWPSLNGILRFSILATVFSASLLGLLLLGCGGFLGEISKNPEFYTALSLGAGIMVLQCIDNTVAGALQGLHFVVRSLLPQSIVVPSTLMVFTVGAKLLHAHPDAVMLLAVQLGSSALIEVYQLLLLSKLRPMECRASGHQIMVAEWLRNSLPFLGNGILFVINTQADTLLLGYFKGGNSAAIYQIGTRGAQIVVLSLGAIATAVQPRLAGLHVAGDGHGVKRLVTQTTRLGFMIALAGAVFLFALGGPLIRLLYGLPFIAATSVLFILISARLVNASVGSMAPYLAMTGKEHLLLRAFSAEAAANIGLNLVLIPRWGLIGSALATGISMVAANLTLAVYVYGRWGVDVSILGLKGTTNE